MIGADDRDDNIKVKKVEIQVADDPLASKTFLHAHHNLSRLQV